MRKLENSSVVNQLVKLLRSTVKDLQEKVNGLEVKAEGLQELLTVTVTRLQEKIIEQGSIIAALTRKLAQTEKRYEARIVALENENAALKLRIVALENENVALENENVALKLRIVALENENVALKLKNCEQDARIAELTYAVHTLKNDLWRCEHTYAECSNCGREL